MHQEPARSAPGEGLKMGKWGLSDTIAEDEAFLSFGQLSFGVADVRGADEPSQVIRFSIRERKGRNVLG